MDTFHEFATEAFFAVSNGCEGPEDRAEHDDVEDVIADLIHCFALLLFLPGAGDSSSAATRYRWRRNHGVRYAGAERTQASPGVLL
ncbi:hypothetical protein, partial [Stutzerimonas degradans]|uniref:hypothetical protein n=1 Tax=Stutzerimonas degradans TaxID=2968968 RepID=UPI001C49B517